LQGRDSLSVIASLFCHHLNVSSIACGGCPSQTDRHPHDCERRCSPNSLSLRAQHFTVWFEPSLTFFFFQDESRRGITCLRRYRTKTGKTANPFGQIARQSRQLCTYVYVMSTELRKNICENIQVCKFIRTRKRNDGKAYRITFLFGGCPHSCPGSSAE
jgi:hypothetical protein